MRAYKMIWVNGAAVSKLRFFMWKVWRSRLPLDDFFRRLGYLMASKCWCCAEPREETTQHLFFTSYATDKVWKYYLGHAGIPINGITFHQAIVKCWTAYVVPRLKPIMQALPSSLIKVRKPSIQYIPHRWPEMIKMMEQYTPKLKYTKVLWELPDHGWIKVNTDGASKGNPGRSSIGFVLRNEVGDVIYACGKEIHEASNTVAEAKAIYEALRFCVQHDYILIDLHTDSMLLKNLITGEWKPPWQNVRRLEE
ncbi:PREDICTED: uncharacterized protein LOC109222796 [Nicotiana attenuata]|uniref:uncharacterized protein LOC109222796 n=1 Tax=Nicotiana attenuata TaxID=49451 RepID=UPI000904B949|nr:PREDICTED: uncharacterized protein LOC109222796 [Nicotiana attenuata]